MAESFAFQIAGQILSKLANHAIHEIGLIWGVKAELKRLEHTVSSIKAVLLDAADQKKKSRHVEDWLEKLQAVLYDIDDLLDDLITEQLRREVLIKGRIGKMVRNFFSSSNIFSRHVRMSQKLKKIRSILKDIDANRKQFDLVDRVLNNTITSPVIRETHSFVHSSEVIGRDDDKNRIVELLLSSSTSSGASSSVHNITVFSIVGLGGLGKTTLAKLIYNNDTIVSNFERRLWICVSEEFDSKKLIEKIIKDATGRVDHVNLDLNQLQAILHTSLNSTKFLLVLDDVWNEDQKKWEDLKELLSCGSRGSTIIVTTRKKATAEIMCTSPPYELKGLSNDECMSIFIKYAFRDGEEKQYPKLLEIGKAIVMKCKGLPIAARSVGSLLSTKREEREWVYIRDNDVWKTPQKGNDIYSILKLSYDEMPLHLKRCFTYCAKFPKDVMLTNYRLVGEWMANGLIQSPSDGGEQQVEDIGHEYFLELLSRSFFQIEASFLNNVWFNVKMHDLVHDLALLMAGKEVLHFKYDMKIDFEGTRHLLFCAPQIEGGRFPQSLLKLDKLRSFEFQYEGVHINKIILDTLVQSFSCLRALSLDGSQTELPSSVGRLKHLRLLSIRGNKKIKVLPNNIGKLVNLQTVSLYGCVMLQCLPRDFGNLWRLRTLCLTGQMNCFPEKGVAEGLCSLQFLRIFSCYHLESLSKRMRSLSALRQLFIMECPYLTSLPSESMKHLTCLQHLLISKCEKLNLIEEESNTLELPRSLLSLALNEIPEVKKLPAGFERASASIEYIDICNCSSFEILPEWLKKCTSLDKLRLRNCSPNLQEKCARETGEYWHLISHIPNLQSG